MSKEIRIENVILEEALKEIQKIWPEAKFNHRSTYEGDASIIYFGTTTARLLNPMPSVFLTVERRDSPREEVRLPLFEDPRFQPKLVIDVLVRIAKMERELKEKLIQQNEEIKKDLQSLGAKTNA